MRKIRTWCIGISLIFGSLAILNGIDLLRHNINQLASATSQQKIVTIHDQTTKRTILTEAATVEAVLKEANIEISEVDLVEPGLKTEVSDGFFINIFRAKPLTIIDGNRQFRIRTPYRLVADIIKHAGIEFYDEDQADFVVDQFSVGSGIGVQLKIKRSTAFELNFFGKISQVRTQATTIDQFLDQKQIKLTENDHMNLAKTAEIRPDMKLEIWREGEQEVAVEEEIAFSEHKVMNYEKPAGFKEVQQAGVKGKRLVTYKIEIKNGVEVSRVETNSVTIVEPKEQVITVGAKGRFTTPSENENKTWDFLISNGFSRVQTAGIMGNLKQEHGFSTTDTSGGLGIVQWTGGRRTRLINTYPDSWDTIDSQLNFLMSELNGGYSKVKQAILASGDLTEVVRIFQNQYERCNPRYCMEGRRIQYASDILASH
ncbi:MAG: phage tail tip lysozyme [Candidatus Saccharibacteria bacterium]|nr:phage tail tip lysozyme [Candidatus Saccharibacteria bacterium]